MMHTQILLLLYYSRSVLSAEEISLVIGHDKDKVINELHKMQESDCVFLKKGFYRLSERMKKELECN